ncbi:Uncharacterised protein [Bordetella pertussis]|nr:Uncharacterised protein [Bordetella pertussis]CPK82883.1 Uncharacterised protein [Bordetella pertussis]CPM63199.1 Uncharacterised protein [Bordetella pertussis]
MCSGAYVTLSSTLMCGNRLNCWNTKPMPRRSVLMFTPLAWMSWPSMRMTPLPMGSSRLMVRMSVDLPEPDGSHTTSTSPRPTSRLTSLSTWCSPYHLLTPSSLIML